MVQSFLLGKAADVESFESFQGLARVFEIVSDGFVGKITDAVVVAFIADVGGKLGGGAQGVFPFVVEKSPGWRWQRSAQSA